jgi:D-lactate dehydrogenase
MMNRHVTPGWSFMGEVAVYDSKPYDRDYLSRAASSNDIVWRFHEFRLSSETALAAKGAQAVCVFVNDHAVAEHAVGLLLTLNRKIHRAYNRVRELNFSLNGLVGFDIHGKTVGIVGTGKIGRIAAQIFRGFAANVMAYDPLPTPNWATEHGIVYTDFDSLLAASDIISLHLPLMPDTLHLLNSQTLARTKPGVFIVNTSRGKLIDTTALIAALKSGHIGGVALDVYEEEEGIFFQDLSGQVLLDDELSRLLVFPMVLITAHQAFLTHEALSEIARVTTMNILAQETNQPFLNGTEL